MATPKKTKKKTTSKKNAARKAPARKTVARKTATKKKVTAKKTTKTTAKASKTKVTSKRVRPLRPDDFTVGPREHEIALPVRPTTKAPIRPVQVTRTSWQERTLPKPRR